MIVRLLWLVTEVVAGVLMSGLVASLAVPNLTRAGFKTGPEISWVLVIASVAVCIVAGEYLRRRRRMHRAS